MQAIPAIDLKDGRTVRLFKGRFDAVSEYDFSPEDLVRQYLDLGVEWVHVVDLDGARSGSGGNREVIGRMAEIAEGRIQVGGGIRTRKDVDELVGLGAGRVVVGSAAAENAKEVLQWIDALGPEKVVLAFDVRINVVGLPIVLTRGWTRRWKGRIRSCMRTPPSVSPPFGSRHPAECVTWRTWRSCEARG